MSVQEPRVRSVNGIRTSRAGVAEAVKIAALMLLAGRPVDLVYDDFSAFEIAVTPHAGHYYALSVRYKGASRRGEQPKAVAWARGSSDAARRLLRPFGIRSGHDRDTVMVLLEQLDAAIRRLDDLPVSGPAPAGGAGAGPAGRRGDGAR